ncbi:MAG: hypothetical protein IKH30_04445 [Clostridia bacterium]|nr:hypothetical protein [Clostridia bacterium]MBR4537961.1 hypothetical protein [Clostridia bacterium]
MLPALFAVLFILVQLALFFRVSRILAAFWKASAIAGINSGQLLHSFPSYLHPFRFLNIRIKQLLQAVWPSVSSSMLEPVTC